MNVHLVITRGEWWEWLLYFALTSPIMVHSFLWWRRDRREREEATHGTPEPPACHVAECPHLETSCTTH